MNSVLMVIKNELVELEKGFTITDKEGNEHEVNVILAQVVGDNLGLHSILSFSESFRFDYNCDLCLSTADAQQTYFRESAFVMRTAELYKAHVDIMTSTGNPSFGLKRNCCLSELDFYHPAENFTCDIMHDLLEGVAQFEINLFLKYLFLEKKIEFRNFQPATKVL
jgi:hypothetical protein